MRDQLRQRLDDLKSEFNRGQEKLSQLEIDAVRLRETLLRISGAIQVLEEELAKDANSTTDAKGDNAVEGTGTA